MTRLELLERVNALNVTAVISGDKYWTVTVLYNTVIYRAIGGDPNKVAVAETFKGIPQ